MYAAVQYVYMLVPFASAVCCLLSAVYSCRMPWDPPNPAHQPVILVLTEYVPSTVQDRQRAVSSGQRAAGSGQRIESSVRRTICAMQPNIIEHDDVLDAGFSSLQATRRHPMGRRGP